MRHLGTALFAGNTAGVVTAEAVVSVPCGQLNSGVLVAAVYVLPSQLSYGTLTTKKWLKITSKRDIRT